MINLIRIGIFVIFCAALTSCATNSPSDIALKKGNSYADEGQYQRAVDEYAESIKLASTDSDRCMAYSNRGYIYLVKLGEIQKGIDDKTAAINLGETFNKFNFVSRYLWKEEDYADRALWIYWPWAISQSD